MSKKHPKASTAELVEARVIEEEDWSLAAFRAGVPFPEMRRLAMMPKDAGGLGSAISEQGLRSLVKQARIRHGEVKLDRNDRIDRQQVWIDERARLAREDLMTAAAMMRVSPPRREDFDDPPEYAAALAAHAKMIEACAKMVDSADRRLAAAQKDEREIHGDNAATKIEAEVVTRDGILDELNASLAVLDMPLVEKVPGS